MPKQCEYHIYIPEWMMFGVPKQHPFRVKQHALEHVGIQNTFIYIYTYMHEYTCKYIHIYLHTNYIYIYILYISTYLHMYKSFFGLRTGCTKICHPRSQKVI